MFIISAKYFDQYINRDTINTLTDCLGILNMGVKFGNIVASMFWKLKRIYRLIRVLHFSQYCTIYTFRMTLCGLHLSLKSHNLYFSNGITDHLTVFLILLKFVAY